MSATPDHRGLSARTLLLLLSFVAAGGSCRSGDSSAVSPPKRRLAGRTCESLLPAARARAILGHEIRYRQSAHQSGAFEIVSCENRSQRAREVFAYDLGCGVGAQERFVSAVRALRGAIRLSAPKVGDEAWASGNVYVSWFAASNCYTTVLISWKRPHPDRLRNLARYLSRSVPPAPGG